MNGSQRRRDELGSQTRTFLSCPTLKYFQRPPEDLASDSPAHVEMLPLKSG